jgi:hypothetical protein
MALGFGLTAFWILYREKYPYRGSRIVQLACEIQAWIPPHKEGRL